MWRHFTLCIARQGCAIVRRWRFLATIWVLHFQQAACSTFQTCILNSHYGHTCGSMVDIQSPTTEIRRGKNQEEERRRKKQDKNIMSASATQGGHKKWSVAHCHEDCVQCWTWMEQTSVSCWFSERYVGCASLNSFAVLCFWNWMDFYWILQSTFMPRLCTVSKTESVGL